ncbi:MFS transporter [Thiotrichales bacterium 19S3-7]|nr:MFS transporter [Thiotrichales bacterium 19S3-7]MCF6802709.1 MFS transporter [Thiotrichales bacterium 19S3-11]
MLTIRSPLFLFLIACIFALISIFLQVDPISTSHYVESRFSLTTSQLVDISALYFPAYALFQIPNGLLLDKYGIKKILPAGIFLTLIGSLLYWLSPNSYFIAISRSIIGVGCSIGYIGAAFIAAKSFKPKYLPLCIAIIEMTSTFGAILAQNSYTFVLQEFGWNLSNLILIFMILIILVLSLISLKNTSFTLPNENHMRWSKTINNLKDIFTNKALLGIFAYSFFTWGIIMGFAGFWTKEFYESVYHYSKTEALDISEIYWLSFIISAFFIGLLARSLKAIKGLIILLAALGATIYIIRAIPIIANHFDIVLYSILCGLSASGVVLAFSLVPYYTKAEVTGTAIALNNTFIVLGGFVSQIMFGYAQDTPIRYASKIFDLHIPHIQFYDGLFMLTLFSIFSLIAISLTTLLSRKSLCN